MKEKEREKMQETKGTMLKVKFKNKEFEIKKDNLIFALNKLGYDEKEMERELAKEMENNTKDDIVYFLKKYGLYNEVFLDRINELVIQK